LVVLSSLLDGGHSKIAGRLAGAFRNIGRDRIADRILETMRSAGFTVQESDPFEDKARVEDEYVSDACHSLSIEGYQSERKPDRARSP
jgi:hypothetical protein